MNSAPPLPAEDLAHILERTGGIWEDLRGASLFITGASGFVGIWLLESLLHADDVHDLGVRIVALSRSPERFNRRYPHLMDHPSLEFQPGDMADFTSPDGVFTHVIHAATTPYPFASGVSPRAVFEHDLAGTCRVLELAREKRIRRLLFTSSGAVYGRQPPELSHIPEEFPGAPSTLDVGSGYGQAKRASEFLCLTSGLEYGFDVVIARLFAFTGPHLPLDSIFAVGNFVRDALCGGPIVIQGDGTPCRSYLYAADMAVWLWGLLLRGRAGEAYNVGSHDALSILDLARMVAHAVGGGCAVRLAGRPDDRARPLRYIPNVGKIGRELGYHARIDVRDGISRFLEWQADALAFRRVDKRSASTEPLKSV